MRRLPILFLFFLLFVSCIEKGRRGAALSIDLSCERQTMHSFGASDCWRTQYVGANWPEDKRNAIADLLFSTEFDACGNPKGIGLSLWRFNIGSGSHEAGDAGGVESDWRRTECFLSADGTWDWERQKGQRWMLEAARERGVSFTLGFSITAPYFMTINGMARASERVPYANLRSECYDDYASFLAKVSKELEFDYLSPINEPQWEWVGSNQEGMQATNAECARLVRCIDEKLTAIDSDTEIVFGEAGDIRYLYRDGTDKPMRDNQIKEMFVADAENDITCCNHIADIISGHSYWSTWPLDTLVHTRQQLRASLLEGYDYWQTEYCPMEQNEDNPSGGNGRDLGMQTALYIARVIHYDLTVAEATSWQWWTAFSEWNYKDGLIYIDDGYLSCGAFTGKEQMIETCKYDGIFRTSKMLWALGNYSFFVRPGMKRVQAETDNDHLLVSAFTDSDAGTVVSVVINTSESGEHVKIKGRWNIYETSSRCDLQFKGCHQGIIVLPPRSITTLVKTQQHF